MILELSFAAAVKLALERNADLQSATATFRSTQAQEGVARGGWFPQINGTLAYSESGGSQAAPGAVDQGGSYTASITANENLFAGLQTMGALRQAHANTRAALETMRTTRARVGYDLVTAFAGVVYAGEYLKLNDDIIHRREENMRLVQLRYQSGRENEGSVLLSQAYLAQARFDLLQSQNALRVARAQLARAVGVDEYGRIAVSGEVPVVEPTSITPEFSRLAVETPDLRLATAQAEAADAGMTVARATFYPQLGITAADNRYGPDFFPKQRERWSMGVNLTMPFFNGGKDYYNLRAAAETRNSSELGRANTARQTLAKLEQAWATYVEGVAKLKVDESFRRAATLRAEIARKKYNNGLQTFDDWDVIENDLITRQKSYLASKRDRTTAEHAWNQALGKGVFE